MKEQFNKDEFLARWLKGGLSEEELKSFEADEEFETFKAIAELSKDVDRPIIRKEKLWSEIEKQRIAPAKVRSIRPWLLSAAAAIVLALLTYNFLFQNQAIIYSTPIASQQIFTLPDGSEVTLNALSKLSFDEDKFNSNRILELEGEAFFEVREGSKFLVKTENGNVQVLGTSFNVFSRKDKLDVSCYTGSVGIYFNDETQMETLSPNDKIITKGGKIVSKISLENRDSPEWSDAFSRFHMASLVLVLEEMERQYDIKISYPSELETIKDYNGGFPHNNIETALQIVLSSFDYQFEINGKEVRVFK